MRVLRHTRMPLSHPISRVSGHAKRTVKQEEKANHDASITDFNGGYIRSLEVLPEPVEELSPWAVGEIEGKKSWALSEKLVGQKFDF